MVLAMDSLRVSLDMGDFSGNNSGGIGGQAYKLGDAGDLRLPMFHLLDH